MSGFFDDEPPAPRRPVAAPQQTARSRALIGTAVVLVVTFILVRVFTGVWTDKLWFSSVGYASVFSTLLFTKVKLFFIFALLMAVAVGINLAVAHRFRPIFRPASPEQANLDRYRDVVEPMKRWLLLGVSALFGLFAGASGSGQWRNYLLWRNGGDFGTTDPYFNKDAGFYVFHLPWLHYLVDFGMAVVIIGILTAGLVHYLYGGIRLQSSMDKLSGAAHVHLSVLLGLFVLLKSVDYYLGRFDLTTDTGGLITGMTYTDDHAVLPSKNILMFIALICALLLFANVFRRTWLLPSVGLGLLVLSAILLGLVWPGIVQNFQVRPSEPDKERPYIARNIEATRAAYQIDKTIVTPYAASTALSPEQLKADAQSIPGIRLLDPSLVNATFEQLQQVKGYYSVPQVLDVDRYPVDGQERDMVVAVRELHQDGLPDAQKNWANLHTVYTHGYGMIAAYGNQRNAADQPVENDGEPVWAEEDIPPHGDLTDLNPPNGYQPQIYFGEQSPNYSIVGKPANGQDLELDIPEGEGPGGSAKNNTYDGLGGVPVGGLFTKLLYAVKFSDPNIVLSSRVHGNSKILYDRSPRDRVQEVAPWLTVDSDVFPAAIDGRVKWILDGYTISDRFPLSERKSLREMTSDALNPRTAYATLPTDQINYMRNAVKAVVDAYDGTVTLYQWDTQDPILRAWMKAFPGVVKRRDQIPPALLEHMRYPEDMFKVQRNLLAAYHVTDARTFYDGNDKWEVPQDPESERNLQPPYRLSVRTPSGGNEPVFSLTSVFVPTKRQNLASFISVDADAAQPDYGTIRILRLPGNTQIPGPSQIANQFGADSEIQNALLAFTRTNSQALYGNLLTLPVGNGLLYVQPLYTLRQTGAAPYPVLRFVLVSFGKEVGFGTTLAAALDNVLGVTNSTGETPGTGTPGTPGDGSKLPKDVTSLLEQAQAKFTAAEQALQDKDLGKYAQLTEEARQLVVKALAAATAADQPKAKAAN